MMASIDSSSLANTLTLPRAHVGGADVDLQRAARHADRVEVDRLLEHALQRIEVERIELVGRQQPGDHVEHQEGRRMLERARAGQLVEQARLQRAEGRGMADPPPEIGERLLRAALAAFGQAVGKHGGVHGAGAGRDHALEGQIVLVEQPVEHAPGEGAVRAAALQSEVDRPLAAHGWSGRLLGAAAGELGNVCVGVHESLPQGLLVLVVASVCDQCAVQPPSTGSAVPVIEAALSLHRKTASAPISSTVAKRLVGWFFRKTSRMTASRAMLCDFAWSSICFSTSGVHT